MLRKSPIPGVYSLSKMADIHGFQIRGDPKNHVSKSWDDPILQGPRLLNCWENFRRRPNTGAFQSPQNSTARNCWSTYVYLPTFTIKNQATVIKYIPSLKLTVRTWKCSTPGKGESYWKPSFLGAMLVFRRVPYIDILREQKTSPGRSSKSLKSYGPLQWTRWQRSVLNFSPCFLHLDVTHGSEYSNDR